MKNDALTPEQIKVLFNKATEAPFSGALLHNDQSGTYACANCGAELFESSHKYDSGSGWPSFDSAVDGAVNTAIDTTHGMQRIEISCGNCGGHLGHVFPDGPIETTGQRYCVNSLSLNFIPDKDTIAK